MCQIIAGFGVGLCLQGPNNAAQAVLSKQQVSVGLSVINLAKFLGSTIFVTVAQALLESRLIVKLGPLLPDVDLSDIANSGAGSIRNTASKDQLPAVITAYSIRSGTFGI
jgi:hypothetical protein